MMYNRYIPQPDGSYRKSRVPEPRRSEPPAKRHPAPKRPPDTVQNTAPAPCPPNDEHVCRNHDKPVQCRYQQHGSQDSLTGFFKQLLPKNIDTADLLIILLLLLMAGDCEEERNNALLTLALYFFM